MERRDKANYYLDIADAVSERSTCLRRRYGAVIVNKDQIISTGYVGAPRGRQNRSGLGHSIRDDLHLPRGERYELCRSVHAEMNAIINASREQMIGATLYLCGREVESGEYIKNSSCCSMCKRVVINSGIERVVIRDDENNYRTILTINWVRDDESVQGTFGY